MEKRLILAIAFSILIVLGFQYMVPKQAVSPTGEAVKALPAEAIREAEISQIVTPPAEERELIAETDNYILTFSNVGAGIKKITLKKYRESNSVELLDLIDLTNPSVYLLSTTSSTNPALDTGIYAGSLKDGIVTYTLKTSDISITKKFTLHNSLYAIELDMTMQNRSKEPKPFSYRMVGGAGLTEPRDSDKRLVEVTADINGKYVGFKRPKRGERTIHPGTVSWTTLKNKYFSLVLKPFMPTRSQFYGEDKNGSLSMGVDTEIVSIPSGGTIDNRAVLYAGPSSISMLKALELGLEGTVNYGFFGGISKVMIAIMGFFHSITRSWGFSIILLAIFLNVILFPLTAKSFKSMQKMQELHPQMEQLKKQYKESPEKLNKAVMELYKKYKINPLSGCLPILLQMPIFIALYSALMKAIELRNTRFLWIADLSAPDAVPIPFTLPIIGNSINILPLIMVGAMVMQQKISTKTMGSAVTSEQKEQQKIMLIAMPIVFGFVFYNMPSGLVLYWVVNTLLTIAEQSSMARKSAA